MAGILRNFQLALKNVFLKIKKDVYLTFYVLNRFTNPWRFIDIAALEKLHFRLFL